MEKQGYKGEIEHDMHDVCGREHKEATAKTPH